MADVEHTNPVGVREAKRRGDTQFEWTFNGRDRWNWVEASVWTERMLEALERGVKGGKWHSLMDKVYALATFVARLNKSSAIMAARARTMYRLSASSNGLRRNCWRFMRA